MAEVIAAALDQFGLDSRNALSYRMLKLTLERGEIIRNLLHN